MVKLNALRVDPEKVEGGVWIDYVDGSRLKVARLGNNAFQSLIRKLTKPYRKEQQAGGIPDKVLEDMTRKAVAKCVLLDWEGVEGEDGEPLKYDPKLVYEGFKDGSLADLFSAVQNAAAEAENYRAAEREESAKN